MPAFREYLEFVSPETWDLLKHPNIGFHYVDRFEYRVLGLKDIFERLLNPPHIDRLKEATGTIQFDVRLTFRDAETGLEHETVVAHTKKRHRGF